MKPPTCRLCGERHWASEPHIFPKDGPPKRGKTPRPDKIPRETPAPERPETESVAVNHRGRSFDAPGKAWIEGWRCRCGHTWAARGNRPKFCPKCKARTWDRGGD